MELAESSLREEVARGLRGGRARWEIVRLLRRSGLGEKEAEAFFNRTRLEVLREDLPSRLRRSGRKHLVIGSVAMVVALGVAVLAARLIFHVLLSGEGDPALTTDARVAHIGVLAALGLILSGAEILWALSRFRMARRLEGEGRPRA